MALSDTPNRPFAEVDRIAHRQLQEVEARIARLEVPRAELKRMLQECGCDTVAACCVLELLCDHCACYARRDARD